MPTVVLTASAVPPEGGERQRARAAGPLFRGNGDIDYLCGSCRFVIASAMGSTQRVPFDSAVCPACGATNAFPAGLRG